jgi:hypothetical protein
MKVIFVVACFVWGSLFMPYEDKNLGSSTTTVQVTK